MLGVLLAAIGWGILAGASWARVGGVAVAALAVVANFLWLPYQPLWASSRSRSACSSSGRCAPQPTDDASARDVRVGIKVP